MFCPKPKVFSRNLSFVNFLLDSLIPFLLKRNQRKANEADAEPSRKMTPQTKAKGTGRVERAYIAGLGTATQGATRSRRVWAVEPDSMKRGTNKGVMSVGAVSERSE